MFGESWGDFSSCLCLLLPQQTTNYQPLMILCGLVACVVAAVSRLVAGCCSGTLSNSNYDVMAHPRYSHLVT